MMLEEEEEGYMWQKRGSRSTAASLLHTKCATCAKVVFKAHRLCVSLNSRRASNKERKRGGGPLRTR